MTAKTGRRREPRAQSEVGADPTQGHLLLFLLFHACFPRPRGTSALPAPSLVCSSIFTVTLFYLVHCLLLLTIVPLPCLIYPTHFPTNCRLSPWARLVTMMLALWSGSGVCDLVDPGWRRRGACGPRGKQGCMPRVHACGWVCALLHTRTMTAAAADPDGLRTHT